HVRYLEDVKWGVGSGQYRFDSCELAEIDQGGIQTGTVAETGIFIRPTLQQRIHVAVRSDKAMGPEGNPAFVEPLLYVLTRWLEDGCAGNHHLELAVHATQSRQHAFSDFADEADREAPGFAFCRNTMFGEACWPQLAGERRRAGAVADDLDFLLVAIDMLQIAVVDTLFAELREQQHGERGVGIAESGGPVAVFEHHALREAGGRIVVAESRERLDGVEIPVLAGDQFLEGEVQPDGALIHEVAFRAGAKELRESRLQACDFLRRDRLSGADEVGRITGVDVDTKHAHPLRGVGDAAGLTHAAATKSAEGRHVEKILQVRGTCIADNLEYGQRIVRGAI